MKKILYVFTSFLLCVVVISLSVIPSFAISAPNGGDLVFSYFVYNYQEYSATSNGGLVGTVSGINPDEAVEDKYYSVGSSEYAGGTYSGAVARFSVSSNQNTVLFESGGNFSFSFNGIVYTNNADSFNVAHVDYYFDYADGTNSGQYIEAPNSSVTYEGYFANSLREMFKVSLNFEPIKDVTKVNVRVYFRLNTGPNNRASYSMGYGNPDINIVNQGSNVSILGAIRDWLSGIYNTLVNTVSNQLSNLIDIIVGTDTKPGLVGQITGFFSDFVDTVVDFIQSIVTGEIIEDLHTLISGSLLSLPDLNSFTQAVSDYLIEEGNILNIIGEYDNFVSDFYDEINIGTQDIPFGIGKGLLVASACVTYISTEIPLVNELLYFSLAVGVVGFVLGSTWLVGKFISTHREDKNFTYKNKF